MLRVAALVALSVVALGARVQEPSEGLRSVDAVFGVPKLQVLLTSNATEAGAFLQRWSGVREFGLFVGLVPDSRAFYPKRVGSLGICYDTDVLLFDLKPFLRKDPRPLPATLHAFMESANHTFYGLGPLCERLRAECATVQWQAGMSAGRMGRSLFGIG